jgi:hypothetical protein
MPLLDFNPRRYLKELRQANSGDLATVATVATDILSHESDDIHRQHTLEKTSIDINEIPSSDRYPDEFSKCGVATAATVATPQENHNNFNELSGDLPPLGGGYTPAKAGYIDNGQAEKILAQLDAGVRVDATDVIAVLREANADFMERAAISEFDGGLTRLEAERLALEELVIQWWEGSSHRQKARATLWGDVRRLAYKELLRQVSE